MGADDGSDDGGEGGEEADGLSAQERERAA